MWAKMKAAWRVATKDGQTAAKTAERKVVKWGTKQAGALVALLAASWVGVTEKNLAEQKVAS